MNALEQFYIELDQSDWDAKDEREISQKLINIFDVLSKDNLQNLPRFVEIERQTFYFSISPEKQLSFRIAGSHKMSDGCEIPYEWPDIRSFQKDDFEYIFERFKSCKNTYAKAVYGLVLFYSKNKEYNDFVIELLNTLFELFKKYIEKAKSKEDKYYYIIYSQTVLSNALHIANNRKKNAEIEKIYKLLIEITFDVHQNWDITHQTTLRSIIDFTEFVVLYFKDFKQYVDVNKFINKNREIYKYLTDNNIWGAIYVTDISMKLCRKLEFETKDWLYFKAEQYEKLSVQSKGKRDLSSLTFIEEAMSIYKNLKDDQNLTRVQKEYQLLRTEFKLGELTQEMPQDETQRIMEQIKKEIAEKSEEEIIKTLLFTPMISQLTVIKEKSEEASKEFMLQNMLPVNILDKFGNTIAKYSTEEDRKKINLLETYNTPQN